MLSFSAVQVIMVHGSHTAPERASALEATMPYVHGGPISQFVLACCTGNRC
jgi:hypothetical protein